MLEYEWSCSVLDIQSLLNAGRIKDAAQKLSEAALAGDIHALYEMALWAVMGNIIPRNLAFAYDMLGKARHAGHPEAALLYAYFTATGTGCISHWEAAFDMLNQLAKTSTIAQRQANLLGDMQLSINGFPSKSYDLEPCSSQPKVAVCHQLLTADECDYVIDVGSPFLTPSNVVDPDTGKTIPHPVRRSSGAMFGVYSEDMVINAINSRIAAVSRTDYKQGEPLQLLQYQRGDEYKPHLDALPNEQNQRVMTVIIYLSEEYDGGETQFLRTGFSFKGEKGDALLFSNTLPNGQPDPLSLHCGTPLISGTKTIATRWIRRWDFSYPDPPSILDDIPGFSG
jgi:prolyl 4-hydroxylase